MHKVNVQKENVEQYEFIVFKKDHLYFFALFLLNFSKTHCFIFSTHFALVCLFVRIMASILQCSTLFTSSSSLSSYFVSIPTPPLYIGASRSFPSRLFIIYSHPLSPMSVFLAVRLPPLLLLLCISCIVNSSQKHDKVSARVPCASLLCSPSYLLLSPRYRACLSLSRVLYSVFFLCVRKAKVN